MIKNIGFIRVTTILGLMLGFMSLGFMQAADSNIPPKIPHLETKNINSATTAQQFATEVLIFQHKATPGGKELIDANDWPSTFGTIVMFKELANGLDKFLGTIPTTMTDQKHIDARTGANKSRDLIYTQMKKITNELAHAIILSLEKIGKTLSNRIDSLDLTKRAWWQPGKHDIPKPDNFVKFSPHSTDIGGFKNPFFARGRYYLTHERNRLEYMYTELADIYQEALHCAFLINTYRKTILITDQNDTNEEKIKALIKSIDTKKQELTSNLSAYIHNNSDSTINKSINDFLKSLTNPYERKAITILEKSLELIISRWKAGDKQPYIWDILNKTNGEPTEEIKQCRVQLETSKYNLTRTTDALRDLKTKYEELQKQRGWREGHRPESTFIGGRGMGTRGDDLKDCRTRLWNQGKEISDLEEQLKTAKEERRPFSSGSREIHTHRESTQQLERENAKLLEAMSSMQNKIQYLTSYNNEKIEKISELREELDTIKRGRQPFTTETSELRRLKETVRNLETQDTVNQGKISDLYREIQMSNTKNEALVDEISDLSRRRTGPETASSFNLRNLQDAIENNNLVEKIFTYEDGKKKIYGALLNILNDLPERSDRQANKTKLWQRQLPHYDPETILNILLRYLSDKSIDSIESDIAKQLIIRKQSRRGEE
jgi:hypothetical protein